jgi:DNA polymerase elongation subunit (family B)
MKILMIDIETTPMTAYTWGLWKQDISLKQIIDHTEVMCFGARWYGSKKIVFKSIHHDGKQAMLEEIHSLLDEADAVVGWNSASFDVKHLNREFLEAGMTPPSPFKNIDLMRVVKHNFRFPSNKLDYVAQKLGVGAKVQHSGFELWIKCMANDNKAWAEMKKYQIQDVHLLIDLYEKLLPWIHNHPSFNLYNDIEIACTNCGSENLERRGFHTTIGGKYQRYQCRDCGKWLRDTKAFQTRNIASAS